MGERGLLVKNTHDECRTIAELKSLILNCEEKFTIWREARRAEVSFLVEPHRVENEAGYASDFTHYLNLLCQAAFKELKLHRLFTTDLQGENNPLTLIF